MTQNSTTSNTLKTFLFSTGLIFVLISATYFLVFAGASVDTATTEQSWGSATIDITGSVGDMSDTPTNPQITPTNASEAVPVASMPLPAVNSPTTPVAPPTPVPTPATPAPTTDPNMPLLQKIRGYEVKVSNRNRT